jgi:outer membrane protein TolC
VTLAALLLTTALPSQAPAQIAAPSAAAGGIGQGGAGVAPGGGTSGSPVAVSGGSTRGGSATAGAGGISTGNAGSAGVGIPGTAGGNSATAAGLGTSQPLALSLADVVNIALGNNMAVIQAQQRLEQSREQIVQVDAQNRPQLRGDASDTYNSYTTTTNAFGPTVQNPVLPSGSSIPTITDEAASEAGTLSAATSPITGTIAPGIATGTGAGSFGMPGTGAGNPGVGAGGAGAPSSAVGAPISIPSAGSPPAGGSPSGINGSSANPGAPGAPTGGPTLGGSGAIGTGGATGLNGPSTPNSGANGTGAGTNSAPGSTPNGGAGTSGANNNASPGNGAGPNDGGANSGANGGSGTSGTGASPGLAAPAAPSNGSGGNPSLGGGDNGSGTGTGANGGTGSTMALPRYQPQPNQVAVDQESVLPQVQVAAMPPILDDFLTASGGGGYVISEDGRAQSVAQEQTPEASSDRARPDAGTAHPDATPATGTSAATSATTAGTYAYRDAYGARLSASQYIDLFGYVPAAREAEQAIRDFYQLDLQRTQNETALIAKSTYFNVLLAQDQVSLEQEQVNYAAENVRITTARRAQGIAADYDVLTAQTALANAQQLLITAQDQLQLAQSQLSYLVGASPDQSITLQTPPLPPLTQTVSLPESITVAEQRRPELQQASRNVFVANRLVKLAHDTLSPTLGIVAVGQYDNVASPFTPRTLGYVSAQLGVPLSDGGATRSRVREAQIALETQQVTRSSLQLSVSLEVRQAVLNIENAQVRVQSAQFGVRQAEEAVRLANVRYQNGLGTFLDVTNSLAQLATARNNLSEANYFYEISIAQLIRDEGGR